MNNLLTSGWRPFCGWLCNLGIAWAFVAQPILSWIAVVIFNYSGQQPKPDIANLIVLLTSMLGFQITRSVDKKNNVSDI